MSPHGYSLGGTLAFSEQVDLGLNLPHGFSIDTLFPHDRLLKLHPNWFVSDFQLEGQSFTASIKDYVSENHFPLSGNLVYDSEKSHLLEITLTESMDIRILFFSQNNTLVVQVDSETEIDPTDPILLWIRAIKEYIRIYVKKTPTTLFWRLVMNRMVLQMNPSQRKICMMLAKITLVEIMVILFIIIGYVIFVL